MGFPLNLASRLSGATPSQLRRWRSIGLVVPEVREFRPPLYSFRDLILLRSLAFLRGETSAQKVTTAFNALDLYELTEHPSRYRFGTDGDTIVVETYDGQALDLVKKPGQVQLFPFSDALEMFHDFKERPVAPLATPAPGIEVRLGRMGGWPTIEGTRIPYDTIARLVDFDSVMPEDVPFYYPSVSPAQAIEAVEFGRQVEGVVSA